MDLFTPMLHAKMMPLLADVYKGRIDGGHAQMNEYGGQKMEAQVIEAGVKFAAVDQVGCCRCAWMGCGLIEFGFALARS